MNWSALDGGILGPALAAGLLVLIVSGYIAVSLFGHGHAHHDICDTVGAAAQILKH